MSEPVLPSGAVGPLRQARNDDVRGGGALSRANDLSERTSHNHASCWKIHQNPQRSPVRAIMKGNNESRGCYLSAVLVSSSSSQSSRFSSSHAEKVLRE